MIPAVPAPEALAELLDKHAHRFPEKAAISVIGDGGKPERIPVLIGNPTGACDMPEGARTSPAWTAMLSSALKLRNEPPSLARDLAEDTVIFPDRVTLATLAGRWPALYKTIADSLEKKLGVQKDTLETPDPSDVKPEPIAAGLAKFPRASWYRLRVAGKTFALVLDPPSSPVFSLFRSELNRAGANPWPLVRDHALGQVKAFVALDGETWAPASIGDTVSRWPGIAPVITGELSKLVGAAAEVSLGEW